MKLNNVLDIVLGIGDWGLGPIPNPQSPIPKVFMDKIIGILIIILTNLYKIQ